LLPKLIGGGAGGEAGGDSGGFAGCATAVAA